MLCIRCVLCWMYIDTYISTIMVSFIDYFLFNPKNHQQIPFLMQIIVAAYAIFPFFKVYKYSIQYVQKCWKGLLINFEGFHIWKLIFDYFDASFCNWMKNCTLIMQILHSNTLLSIDDCYWCEKIDEDGFKGISLLFRVRFEFMMTEAFVIRHFLVMQIFLLYFSKDYFFG